MRSTGAVLLILVVLLAGAGLSQAPTSGLLGTWHSVTPPPLPQTLLIFSAEGHYIQLTIPPGRSQPKNDFGRGACGRRKTSRSRFPDRGRHPDPQG
jgi:hypothetical protein